ncbi:hypothetical protein HCA61_22625 [Rhodococcus sp. HNM0563]|uniref:hypothetical protein n=1 Tax=Rhodococcus sp. HNM0563 TaxID=2716339 RepID=UPI00146F6474|nr:hypothetical protein [Rhodococcus sp. HNM0563]NLU65036.1 hypothetical protein [Rhodococcus sp. HNM0563]
MPNPVLAIDVGACTLSAAVRDTSGRVTPLAIGGTTTPPARLVVQAGQPRPARDGDPVTLAQLGPLVDRLDVPSLVIDGVSWSIESLTGLLLRPVLETAIAQLGTTPKIVLVVPSTWTPELRRRFQRIVHAALTRTVTLIPSDKALAYALPALPVGAGIVAVDCGATDLSAIAVVGGERGPRIIGRAQSDSGGDIFDRFLLANALTDAGFPDQALDARWGFAGVPRVRAAREALADSDAVTVHLPRPVGRITLSEQDVDATGAQYFAHRFSELLTRLDENATEPISHRLMLSGGLAYDPAVPAAARVHGLVKVMAHPQHVLCRGALTFAAAAIDSTDDPGPRPITDTDADDEPAPGGISKRTLALFGGVGASVVVIAVAGGLALSAAMTGAPDFREQELPNVAASVLPANQSIPGMSLRSWTDGADATNATTRSLSAADARSLACGGTRPAAGAEADGMRWQSSRIFVSDDTTADAGAGAKATSWDNFDPSATTNVIVTAAIVGRDDRESVWQDISASNQRCPSTKDDLVRTIVVIPQTGPDPGPPSYAQEIPVASTSRTPTTPPTSTTRAPQGGVTMSTQRQAWRGLTPASVSGTGTDMHVTCVLDIDGVVLKRSCATAKDSGTADHLAQQAAVAFNPAPEITR